MFNLIYCVILVVQRKVYLYSAEMDLELYSKTFTTFVPETDSMSMTDDLESVYDPTCEDELSTDYSDMESER